MAVNVCIYWTTVYTRNPSYPGKMIAFTLGMLLAKIPILSVVRHDFEGEHIEFPVPQRGASPYIKAP